MSNNNLKPVIGITVGDINGVGPEVIIKALSDNRLLNLFTPVIYGSTKVLSYYRKLLKANDFNYSQIKDIEQVNHKRVNVINCWQENIEIQMGHETPEGGNYAFMALERAVEDLKGNLIDGLITAPISKLNIQNSEFNFPGHTEYLTQKLEDKSSLMMMVSQELRIGVVTGHIPLKDVPASITVELVQEKLQIMLDSLRSDFAILKPKIAVLGLNPHAGENGLLGKEEEEIIKPAIAELKNKGHLIYGPYPADGFFGSGQYKKYNGVMAMYHDQGLVPFKLMSFDGGVNFTAGLKKVRTSPAHGTAYSIVGKDLASENPIREAIFLTIDVIKCRGEMSVSVEV